MSSGSELIQSIAQGEQNVISTTGERSRCSLLIGVSARLTEDANVLKKSGADILWAKPPPEMNTKQRNHLLKVLMKKRGRYTGIQESCGVTCDDEMNHVMKLSRVRYKSVVI